MRKSVIALLGIVLLLPRVSASDKTSPEILARGMIFHNHWIYSVKVDYPDFGSRDYRREIERTWRMAEKTFSSIKGKDIFGFTFDPSKSKKIAHDKINIENVSLKKIRENSRIKFSPLYEIDDDFKDLSNIFKIGFNVYFLRNRTVKRQKEKYDGIYTINNEKWYNLVTGTKLNIAADMGKNRVIGYYFYKPFRLFGFNWSFSDAFYVSLPDFRFRQEIHQLSDRKFLFHNYRLNPSDHAVEIYDISGKRTNECFDYVPYDFETKHKIPLAAYTVLTTDKKGHFYIGFQYPLNPYRIWKYDENGAKIAVLGNYFEDPDIYESPEDWIRGNLDDITYYGIDRIYALNKLLTDALGRLFVFFSMNRIARKHRGKDTREYFVDIYSEKGEFIGRKEFKYGFPELIDKDIIYSRMKKPSRSWKITAVRIDIK